MSDPDPDPQLQPEKHLREEKRLTNFIKFSVKYGIRAWNAKRGVKPQSLKLVDEATGIPLTRTASRHESLYSNHATWIKRAQRRVGLKKGTTIDPTELHRVGSHQARATGAALRQ
ncbi:hypothetical protein PtB15_9B356 [Puccinia triticina]|nr:hypothetical protein PtB15_9B356 [Puccinia triticina]